MNILFLSKYYPGDLPSRCSAISKIGLDWAAHNLCTAIIKGFQGNDNHISAITQSTQVTKEETNIQVTTTQSSYISIAVILTCFNRKEKTVKCLRHLFAAANQYNTEQAGGAEVHLSIFLTDDGCTDGTADAVREVCKGHEVHILQGDGKCYWAGGMRLAWNEALRTKEKWQFYLLVNDDTFVNEGCFDLLLEAHRHSISHYGRAGIYSGITCDTNNSDTITYGGYVWTNFLLGRDRLLTPTGKPQMCDKANSNIMLVEATVVSEAGIFWDGFDHGCADYDYSMTARRKGIPVLVTPQVCGRCEYDHHSEEKLKEKILGMTLQQRKEFFANPLHSSKDVLRLKRRNTPLRYPLGVAGRLLNLYLPRLYYLLSDIRNK